VGAGARCCICSERRRDFLRSLELLGAWMPMCFNCSGVVAHLDPMPQTIAGVREAVRRERRQGERRVGKADSRVFQYDRRSLDRRCGRGCDDDWVVIDEEMIVEIAELFEASERPRVEDDADLTCILERPL
jgi:hypothetical protein